MLRAELSLYQLMVVIVYLAHMLLKVMILAHTFFNSPAITDVSRDSIRGGGGSVCGSDVGGVVGAAVGHVVGAAAIGMRRRRNN